MLQRTVPNRRPVILFFVLFLGVALTVPTAAEAFQEVKKKPVEKPSAEKSSADDPFAVPKGNSTELLAFVNEVAKLRPRFRNIQEVRDHLKKANAASHTMSGFVNGYLNGAIVRM